MSQGQERPDTPRTSQAADGDLFSENVAPAPSGTRILLVEDDNTIRNLLTVMLSGAGYTMESAKDGEAGWEALCAKPFDLLITDHDMPRMTGLELLRKVRSSPRNLPVILISGKIPWEATDLVKLLAPGTAMGKPFTMNQLLAQVRVYLPLTKSGDENHGRK